MQLWAIWWVWVVAGIALGAAEILLPGFIFLGFAIGAVATGLAILAGVAPAGLGGLCLLFGVLSLAAWLGLRRTVGVTRAQVKLWKEDINDR